MKFNSLKTFTNTEIVAILLFVVYILFPVQIPASLKPYVSSPVGLVFMFAITMALFVYTNPVLGVLYIFVVYETLRRSQIGKNLFNTTSVKQIGESGRVVQQSPVYSHHEPVAPQPEIQYPVANDVQIGSGSFHMGNNIGSVSTLEEEIVQSHAPIGISEPVQFSQSSFSPVADKLTTSASLF
jgi:hypothetical protein